MSDMARACTLGDVAAVSALLAAARAAGGSALHDLLERREFLNRTPPLLICICASRILGRKIWAAEMEKAADHLGVARLLLDSGARIDARDVAGY